MFSSKEELRLKYNITDADFDVLEALALRPTCEHCNKPLPPNSTEAKICSFECTFCAACVDDVLKNICPNCGGGFEPRPVRPVHNRKNGNYLGNFPARTAIKHKPVVLAAHGELIDALKAIKPEDR
jgi:uncharacterized protein